MPAQAPSVDVSAVDPIAAIMRAGAGSSRLRRLLPLAALLAAGAAAILLAPRIAGVFADALVRAVHADPKWVVAGVAFELLSFAGYIALFWHVASRETPRFGLRASYEVSLAGTAATRLLPTAGAGGAALTFWSLRRAGHDNRTATRTLLTFLVILYSVFLGGLAVAGGLLATGAIHSHVSPELSAVPASVAALAIAIAVMLGVRHRRGGLQRSRGPARALGGAVSEAFHLVGRPDARMLGAVAWWGFDLLVLWSTFNAFGVPPSPVVLVLGYFLGQVANTLPIPGAASGGMVGAFLALGMPAEVVLPSVLAYRAIAIWTPVPAGAAALAGLRRTVKRWAHEDSLDAGDAEEERVLVVPAQPPIRRRWLPAPASSLVRAPRVACQGCPRGPPPGRELSLA